MHDTDIMQSRVACAGHRKGRDTIRRVGQSSVTRTMTTETLPPKISRAGGAAAALVAATAAAAGAGEGAVAGTGGAALAVGVTAGAPVSGGFMAKRSSSGAASALPSDGAKGSWGKQSGDTHTASVRKRARAQRCDYGDQDTWRRRPHASRALGRSLGVSRWLHVSCWRGITLLALSYCPTGWGGGRGGQ